MIITSKIISIGMIIISLAIGLISFYLFTDLTREEKKKYFEIVTSQLINFAIFIWVGKILLNINLFFQDPLAVLAYPSDSNAFYLAFLFSAINIIIHVRRRNFEPLIFFDISTQIILTSLFFHEFLQAIIDDNPYSFSYIVLLLILLIAYHYLRERLRIANLLLIILTGFTIGMIFLNVILPYVAIFGYVIERWFIIIFFISMILFVKMNGRMKKL